MKMPLDYIIVQAGGKGTRMEKLTRNKPKALVPVNNLPMILHLFYKYPEKKFIVIGDYKYDVLEKYLDAFAHVDYKLVCATGHCGTCAGMAEAISYVPENREVMIIWCDLVLPEDFTILESDNNVIGLSGDFPCRWKYENNVFSEERSTKYGVAGYFVFRDKSYIRSVPAEGEFVRWLQSKGYEFDVQILYKTHEYGIFSEWDKLPQNRCRPFNSIRFENNIVYKKAIDKQGQELAIREINWYKKLQKIYFENIPIIYEFEPLTMEFVDGKNIYEYTNISFDEKRRILKQLVDCMRKVHDLECVPSDTQSFKEAYLHKTYNRLEKVKKLVPFAGDENIKINGRSCRNIFYNQEVLERAVMQYMPKEFCLIHGDCTFSNIILRKDSIPVLIDPRGYFGTTELYGDPAYDWAKLYYSLITNYDQFNLKHFDLYIEDGEVRLDIASNQWEELEEYYFELLGNEVTKNQIKLLVAVIWLSLTTYAWEDYDSICGAFYNGLYYLEEALR